MEKEKALNYTPTKTALAFHLDNSLVRCLKGPVGCGKSVACCMELFRIMATQEKGHDGYRRTRMVVIRETYAELKSTTIKTWRDLFPTPETGRIIYDSPITHYFEMGDIRAEVLFISLDREDDLSKLRSLECTFVWINEAKYVFRGILDVAIERAGRYPPKKHSVLTRRGVLLDTNPCDDDHWIFKLFEEEKPPGFKIFHYPPALLHDDKNGWVPNPDAENIKNLNLGYDYYLQMVHGKSLEYIKVYILGEYGTSYDGRPVYPEFNDAIHVARNLNPVKHLPIVLGWDFGLTPACIICQLLPTGQLIILDEITTEYMGIRNFAQNVVIPFLSMNYEGYEIALSIGDPAGNQKKDTDESSCITELTDLGIPTSGARTNALIPRLTAVSKKLSSLIDGKPALLISDRCLKLWKGFKGGYHFRRLLVAIGRDNTKYKEEPEKNQYSHPHDALQYIAMHCDSVNTKLQSNRLELDRLKQELGIYQTHLNTKRFI